MPPSPPCFSDQVGGTIVDCSDPSAFVDSNGNVVFAVGGLTPNQQGGGLQTQAAAAQTTGSAAAGEGGGGGTSISNIITSLGGLVSPISAAVTGASASGPRLQLNPATGTYQYFNPATGTYSVTAPATSLKPSI